MPPISGAGAGAPPRLSDVGQRSKRVVTCQSLSGGVRTRTTEACDQSDARIPEPSYRRLARRLNPRTSVPTSIDTTRAGRLTYNHMVVYTTDGRDADQVFHALADPTRRDIVKRSLTGEFSVSTLADFYPMSFAAVQKHVAILSAAGLVQKRRSGREQLVSGDVGSIRRVSALLDQFEALWRGRMGRFDTLLNEESDKGGKK